MDYWLLSFTLIIVVTNSLANNFTELQGQLHVFPNYAVVKRGDQATFLCRYNGAIDSCQFTLGEIVIFLRPGKEKDGISYYGDGLQMGDCGIMIRQTQERHGGNITCRVAPDSTDPSSLTGSMQLVVSPPPHVPTPSTCSAHDQCPTTKVCILGKCDDPCVSLCGNNTSCTVRFHVAGCACKEGYTGNPFNGCAKLAVQGRGPHIPHGKKQFYIQHVEDNWQEAFMSCIRNNSRLASVENMEELEELRSLIKQTGTRLGVFWTSGSDSGEEGNFYWASTGKKLPSRSNLWLEGQPDNFRNDEHCVLLWQRFENQDYSLGDGRCYYRRKYICEYYN